GMRAQLSALLKERLNGIRAELGTLAGQITGYLLTSENCPVEPENVDFAVVFIMGSAKARASAARWVSDPAGSAADASLKLRILSTLVHHCIEALDHPTAAPPPPEATPPP